MFWGAVIHVATLEMFNAEWSHIKPLWGLIVIWLEFMLTVGLACGLIAYVVESAR
jgi:hypothetical protein